VTTQPTDQTVDAGQTATFAANATGIPAPSIQWQLSADAGQTWTDIPGATASPYSFPANSTESGDQFRAVFTNLAGSATTNPATLTVNTAPTVTTQPTSQSVTDGHTATFSAAASGSPSPAVRWQVSTDAGKTFADIPGATSPVYSLTAILGENGNQYRAVFTNVAGSATTLAATLTVVPALTSITVAPGGLTLAPGMTQAYTATGHYSNGTSKNLTTAVTWSSAAPGVASVSGGGLAKAISPGSADIAATLGSVSGHTGITVSPLRYIWVQPWIHFLPKRASIGYVATGLFANGTWEPITSHVSWTSTNRKVASVSPQGIATGLSRGWTLVSARFGRTYVIPGVLVVW
jgi:hypothetical protein